MTTTVGLLAECIIIYYKQNDRFWVVFSGVVCVCVHVCDGEAVKPPSTKTFKVKKLYS